MARQFQAGRTSSKTMRIFCSSIQCIAVFYRNVTGTDLGNIHALRTKKNLRVPVVLSKGPGTYSNLPTFCTIGISESPIEDLLTITLN
jgi:hypothetical protein